MNSEKTPGNGCLMGTLTQLLIYAILICAIVGVVWVIAQIVSSIVELI